MARTLPWLVLGGGAALAAYAWRRDPKTKTAITQAIPPIVLAYPGQLPMSEDQKPGAKPALPFFGRWVHPVPAFGTRGPTISSGFYDKRPGLPQHGGVDIMYKRLPGDPYRVGTPNGSKDYVMPDHVIAMAAGDGVVWEADRAPTGFQVVIDHGFVATYYAHLENLFVTPTQRGKSKQRVVAGQPLGFIGASPLDPEGLKHLHLEVWTGGVADKINPASVMQGWVVVEPLRVPTTMVA